MTNRTRLPRDCWVTAFSSEQRRTEAAPPAGKALGRMRDRRVGPGRGKLLFTRAPVCSAGEVAQATVTRALTLAIRESRRRHNAVIPQELFGQVVSREQKCAERFDQPFVLLLIAGDSLSLTGAFAASARPESPAFWTGIVEALSAAVGDTAVLGWLQHHALLGAIVPDAHAADLERRVRLELSERLGVSAPRISITSQAYGAGRVRNGPDGAKQSQPRLRVVPPHDSPADYPLKRALDVVGSFLLLVVLSPLFLMIAALLKLTSPGPILFRQARVCQLAQPFTMLKFRTMRVNADPGLHHAFVTRFIRSGAELHSAGRKALFKLTNDPRVTPIGRILRKTSLDELPQLWNVLRGEMSLVGPRPPLPYEVEQYRTWHWRRVLEAKPGLTGLWQVTGRSRTTFDEMVRLDLQYARTCSLWTDLKILLATPRVVMSGKGAG